MSDSPQPSLFEIPSPWEGSLTATATDSTGPSIGHGPGVRAAPAPSAMPGMPSSADVQSDAGEVVYRIEYDGTIHGAAGAGGSTTPRERGSSRSPVRGNNARGRSSSVGHRGHTHLGPPRVATPEGGSSRRPANGETPSDNSWLAPTTPGGYTLDPSNPVTPIQMTSAAAYLNRPSTTQPSTDDIDLDDIPGQTAEEKLDALLAQVKQHPTGSFPTGPRSPHRGGGQTGLVLNRARPAVAARISRPPIL